MVAMSSKAAKPNDLEKLFVSRANERDIEGLLQLYEMDAIVETADGELFVGSDTLRRLFTRYAAGRPALSKSRQLASLTSGDLAMTASVHSNGDVSVEVARRQPNGSWRWVIDRFSIGKLERNLPKLPYWLP